MAISASSYSVGNRVYKGGTNAPTRGTVDPMGYIDRGLNNPSQSRSGLASAAMSRMGQPQHQSVRPGNVTPALWQQLHSPNQAMHNQAQTQINSLGHTVSPIGKITRPSPVPPQGTQPSGPGLGGGLQSPIFTGQGESNHNPTGQVSAPTPVTAPSSTGLPYDPQAAQEQARLLSERDNKMNAYNQQLQGVDENYTQSRRSAELQHPDSLRNLLNSYAARGMSQSSGYGYGFGQNEDQYANALSGLDRQHTQGVNSINDNRNTYDSGYANQLQSIQAAAVQRLSQQAGDLGLVSPEQAPNAAPGIPVAPNSAPVIDPISPVASNIAVQSPISMAPAPAPTAADNLLAQYRASSNPRERRALKTQYDLAQAAASRMSGR